MTKKGMCLCQRATCYKIRSEKKISKYRYLCTQPCFGFFLQGSAKETAIANSFVAIASIIIFSAGIGEFMPRFSNEEHIYKRTIRPFFWTFYYSYWILEIYLSVLLYLASKERNRPRCQKWLHIQLFFFVLWLILFLAHSTWLVGFNPILQTCFWVISLYKVYTFWVIKCFIKQMKVYGSINGVLARLTDEDLEEFEKGQDWRSEDPKYRPYNKDFEIPKSHLSDRSDWIEIGSGVFGTVEDDLEEFEKGQDWRSEDPKYRPYNKDFEIPKSHLNDRSDWIEIGSGEFGTVYHAKYCNHNYDSVVEDVAVKIVNSFADIIYFKALLSELKIMTYIGKHENIVNLIGASTAHISERKLDLIVEFCPYGNLESFLQTRRGFFVNQVDENGLIMMTDQSHYRRQVYMPSLTDTVTTIDLVRWSLDTASGLDFLHQKKVIHGDMAARNILLTRNRVAKISDFGLSRRVYTYKKNFIYDTTPRLLPWRWLAPETLNMNLRFTRDSDKWAFGITLWEFFSLGSCIPYHSSHLDFSKAFATQLQNGMILDRPNYCPLSLYHVMQDCWKINPKDRAQFFTIINSLKSILAQFHCFKLTDNDAAFQVQIQEAVFAQGHVDEQPKLVQNRDIIINGLDNFDADQLGTEQEEEEDLQILIDKIPEILKKEESTHHRSHHPPPSAYVTVSPG